MSQMPFTISEAAVSDAQDIARHVLVPGLSNDPTYKMLLPKSDMTEAQKDEIIRWFGVLLEYNIKNEVGGHLKACSPDGTPIGFCGWTVDVNNGQADEELELKEESCIPETADMDAWMSLDAKIESQRKQILEGHGNTYCEVCVAVNPIYQGNEIGSSMMQKMCEQMDRHGQCAYVQAGPEGDCMYTEFGFKTVGRVETPYGDVTTMFRPSKLQQS